MTGKDKKIQRRYNKERLPNFYVWIQNDRNGYTKLVNRDQALDYTQGKYNHLGIREHNLKDTYTMKEI